MTDNTAPELKPCPFCGAKPHRGLGKIQHDQLHGDSYQNTVIKCPHLCATMEGSLDSVVARWNTRANLADAAVAAAYEQAAREIETRLQVISDTWHNLFVHAGYDAFANRLKAMTDTLVKDIPPFIRALATDEQTDAARELAFRKAVSS